MNKCDLLNILKIITTEISILLKNWPFVTLLIFLFLKKYIKDFVKNIKEVHIPGVTVIQTQVTDTTGTALQNNTLREMTFKEKFSKKRFQLPNLNKKDIYTKVFEQQETLIKQELKDTPFEKESYLVRQLASFRLALNYERIFKDIFKSQIDVLEYINSSDRCFSQS